MKRFILHKVVAQQDLDALDHVNNVRYVQWVQDVAQAHWETLTEPEWDKRYLWVVRSHHIRYAKPALLGQRLELETYVRQARGPISERCVDIRLADSGEAIASCVTEWCLLEAKTLKPVRMPEAMRDKF
ncbi:thioesterase family protein [Robiginitalea sp. M366]|uniref:acyl-CoA thioesterase n=1 Tax=Robiginitalea aestuariiviva TaxID=3036903 RepID=UPI00240E599A|nr:thioesterase family protein [Robiginitalea aestuariiviva]MDG1573102.1 thioesterase family protein [Robiginitalea aestuariiviva]